MSSDDLPEPLVPADHDVSMLSDFRLNVDRLLASELVAVGTAEECWAAFMLWCRAWKQVPGGSLPNDERTLAGFSGAGVRWKKVRDVALHGFILCSDGRWYHRFLCEEVKRAYKSHLANETRRDADRKRLADWRSKRTGHGAETAPETPDETRFVAEEPAPNPEPKPKLASKLISDSLPKDWSDLAAADRAQAGLPEVDLKAEWGRLISKIGEPATLDRWLGWAMKARQKPSGNGSTDPSGMPEIPWPQRCRGWAKGYRWGDDWGPQPDEPGCQAPPDVIAGALRLRTKHYEPRTAE